VRSVVDHHVERTFLACELNQPFPVTLVDDLDIEIRAGLHTGECEIHEGKVAGIAVSIGARISSLADAGEVLVSSTVKDLVAGSELTFEDRGEHTLKGVPGTWRLFTAG